jgi:hypothetical protein
MCFLHGAQCGTQGTREQQHIITGVCVSELHVLFKVLRASALAAEHNALAANKRNPAEQPASEAWLRRRRTPTCTAAAAVMGGWAISLLNYWRWVWRAAASERAGIASAKTSCRTGRDDDPARLHQRASKKTTTDNSSEIQTQRNFGQIDFVFIKDEIYYGMETQSVKVVGYISLTIFNLVFNSNIDDLYIIFWIVLFNITL